MGKKKHISCAEELQLTLYILHSYKSPLLKCGSNILTSRRKVEKGEWEWVGGWVTRKWRHKATVISPVHSMYPLNNIMMKITMKMILPLCSSSQTHRTWYNHKKDKYVPIEGLYKIPDQYPAKLSRPWKQSLKDWYHHGAENDEAIKRHVTFWNRKDD